MNSAHLSDKNLKQPLEIQAVLFDLDGTLIDTAPDFIRIIQEICLQQNKAVPTETAIRSQVSEGARAMVHLIYPELALNAPELLAARAAFLEKYNENIAVKTTLFVGMDEWLKQLESQHIPWGIVTNKPRNLSEKLLEALNLTQRCAVLVCPDDVSHTKPHPEPMFLAAQKLDIPPESIVYIGDHPRDIDAGRNANMPTVLAAYGYLPPEHKDDLKAWKADFIVENVAELATIFDGQSMLLKGM